MSAAKINKFRWWFAKLWDWFHPNSCWASTAMWGMGYDDFELSTDPGSCNKNLHLPPYGCWCTKFCDHAALEAARKRWPETLRKAIEEANADMASAEPDQSPACDSGFFGANPVGRDLASGVD